ncbi:MAG: hypothetical protein QNL04_04950 [SAR324 cluster bacterium]|nr:hypothetical protein [SAR324 cluster bacterium]
MKKNFIILLGLLLSGCSFTTKITETSNIKEEQAYIDATGIDIVGFKNQLMIKDKYTYFFIVKLDQVSEELKGQIITQFIENIENTGLFTSRISEDAARDIVGREGALNQKLEIYLDSLSMIAVSDRDIVTPLGNKMGIDQIFVVQFDQWPCFDCDEGPMMRLKIRLVDVERGLIYWTGIAEREFDEDDLERAGEISIEMMNELTVEFFNKYKPKWHFDRFRGLKRMHNAG